MNECSRFHDASPSGTHSVHWTTYSAFKLFLHSMQDKLMIDKECHNAAYHCLLLCMNRQTMNWFVVVNHEAQVKLAAER